MTTTDYHGLQTTIAAAHEYHRRVSALAAGDHPDFARAAALTLLNQAGDLLKILDDADLGDGGRTIAAGAAIYAIECAEVVMLESSHTREGAACQQ